MTWRRLVGLASYCVSHMILEVCGIAWARALGYGLTCIHEAKAERADVPVLGVPWYYLAPPPRVHPPLVQYVRGMTGSAAQSERVLWAQ